MDSSFISQQINAGQHLQLHQISSFFSLLPSFLLPELTLHCAAVNHIFLGRHYREDHWAWRHLKGTSAESLQIGSLSSTDDGPAPSGSRHSASPSTAANPEPASGTTSGSSDYVKKRTMNGVMLKCLGLKGGGLAVHRPPATHSQSQDTSVGKTPPSLLSNHRSCDPPAPPPQRCTLVKFCSSARICCILMVYNATYRCLQPRRFFSSPLLTSSSPLHLAPPLSLSLPPSRSHPK